RGIAANGVRGGVRVFAGERFRRGSHAALRSRAHPRTARLDQPHRNWTAALRPRHSYFLSGDRPPLDGGAPVAGRCVRQSALPTTADRAFSPVTRLRALKRAVRLRTRLVDARNWLLRRRHDWHVDRRWRGAAKRLLVVRHSGKMPWFDDVILDWVEAQGSEDPGLCDMRLL